MVPLACDEELESMSAGIGRVVMTWVASLEKKVISRCAVLEGRHGRRRYSTYRTQDLSPAHNLVLRDARHAVEVEDELREQALVVLLPLPDRIEVILRPLHLLGCDLGLACGFELPSQGRLRGTGAADKTMTASLRIVHLDDLLLLCWLAVGDIALLTRMGTLALSSHGSRA